MGFFLALAVASAGAQTAGSPSVAPPAAGAASLERQATEAREAGQLDEAIRLYERALRLRPGWDEGLWYRATLLYEAKRYSECVAAFSRFLERKPEAGPAFALRGQCAFEQGAHAAALADMEKALELGLGGNQELLRATRTRIALALLKTGQFERAVEPYTYLARTTPESEGLDEEIGLLLLRSASLPSEIRPERRGLVREVGHAGYLHLSLKAEEAAKAYEALVAGHPNEPWVHYAFGVFLLRTDSDRALLELRRELELQPDNVMAHLEIAFEQILRGDYPAARPHAERAVELAPRLFASQNAFGRVLVEAGEVEAGIAHLEEAVKLAPESPEVHFALGRAYARAGREADAARERATFAELDRKRREKRTDGGRPTSGGGRP